MDEVQRIVITLKGNRRVILYPEGTLETETLVYGRGWFLDSGDMDSIDLGTILTAANAIVGNQAALNTEEVAS